MTARPAQQHKIMRQVLEVRGCARDTARRAQSDIRAAYYRLLPSIEKTCSELSAPDRLQRIDRLEIDLGEVPSNALESAVVEKFERVFAGRLAAAIGSAESTPVDVDLELFTYFLRTGTVPWWADRLDRHLVEKSLDASIRRAPRAVRRAIASGADQKIAWRRLALACSDRVLDDLLGVLASPLAAAYPGLGTHWLALIAVIASGQGHSRSAARILWWEELLRAAHGTAAPVPEAPRFFQAILVRLANRLDVEYGSLVAKLHATLDRGEVPIQPWASDVVEALHQKVLAARARTRLSPDDETTQARDQALSDGAGSAGAAADRANVELERLLHSWEAAPGRLEDEVGRQLKILLPRLSSAERARAVARIRRLPEGAALLRESIAPHRELGVPGDSKRQDARAHDSRAESEPHAPADLTFSDIDEIYVENAGLVILWPFLETFFRHLGLTEGKRFRDPAAQQRAIGLLQCVAAADTEAPEYLVPLNKVLCGMSPDDLFDFGPAMTDDEIEACTDLVAAAIHHAPILRDMSVQGFRGSFLLRQGQLSVRDDRWLLRVERETYDIVLDRFPWNFTMVKLPWMAAIVAVEW